MLGGILAGRTKNSQFLPMRKARPAHKLLGLILTLASNCFELFAS
jgi:hypothetical protein